MIWYLNSKLGVNLSCVKDFPKVSNGAKIRNRYNQVPHPTQDTKPEFYGDLVYKLKKIVGSKNFCAIY